VAGRPQGWPFAPTGNEKSEAEQLAAVKFCKDVVPAERGMMFNNGTVSLFSRPHGFRLLREPILLLQFYHIPEKKRWQKTLQFDKIDWT
jgi:hypothetical protein